MMLLFLYQDDKQQYMHTFKSYTVKQSTYDRLLTSVRALEGYQIASMPICQITSTHIQKYVNELAGSGYGLSTIKKQMRIVTAPLKQAAALHQIPANPAVGIKLPARCNVQKVEQQAEAYSPEEQEALLRVLNTHSRPGFAAIILMIETGLRVGEALALQWKDIQISRKRLIVRATVVRLANKKQSFVQDCAKSESSNRTIPLTPKAVSILQTLKANMENEWVFVGDDGQRLSYEALRYFGRSIRVISDTDSHSFSLHILEEGKDVGIYSFSAWFLKCHRSKKVQQMSNRFLTSHRYIAIIALPTSK